MTVYVIYADASDGDIRSIAAGDYAAARAGTGTLSAGDTSATMLVGQDNYYQVWEIFLSFDTSVVVGMISTAVLAAWVSADISSTDFTINARSFDWGASLTSADWIAGASLSGNTLRATRATSGIGTGAYTNFTSQAGFPAAINQAGSTRLVLSSSRHEGNNTPSGNELVQFRSADQTGTSEDPKLTVTTLDPASVLRPSIRNVLHNLIR